MVSDYDNKFHEPFRIWAQRLNNPSAARDSPTPRRHASRWLR